MGKNIANTDITFLFCDGGSCNKAGSEVALRSARSYLRNSGNWDNTHTIKTRCNGRCEDAPTCIVQSGNYWYKNLTQKTAVDIVKSHIEKNEPLEKELLYQESWEKLQSENNRTPMKPKDFAFKNDMELGECLMTKGFSSDQYLHPLFLFLFEVKKDAILKLPNNKQFDFQDLKKVEYQDIYKIELTFNVADFVDFVIGFVPKTESNSLVQQKITTTEYFILNNSGIKGIRFKDKLGNTVAIIEMDSTEETIWNYCLKIQLGGLDTKNCKNEY